MAVSLSQASFLGLLLQTFVFGIFFLIFCISMFLEWEIRHHSKTLGKKVTLGFSILLCCLIMTHWLLNVWGCYEIYMKVPPGGLREYAFFDMSDVKSMIKMSLYEVQVWMSDLILIFRLYYVCGRNVIKVIFPCIICVAVIVCGGNFLHALAVSDIAVPQSLEIIRKWCTATLSLTLAQNLYCAGMISAHVWRSQRDVRSISTGNLRPVLRIFIESAGMWIFFVLVNLITYVSSSNIFYLFLYMANPILGISFCLMTVRLNLLKRSRTQNPQNTSTRATVGSNILEPKKASHPTVTPFPYLAEPSDVVRFSRSTFSENNAISSPGYDKSNMV